MTSIMRDLRYGLRALRRQPGFAAVAIGTLALGIGTTTILFSITYGVLLKPLPWRNADQLLRLTERRQGRTARLPGTISNATFLAWRQQPTTITDIGGWMEQTSTIAGAGDPMRASIVLTSPGLFPTLQVQPLMGRSFREDEGRRGQPGAVLLSYALWQQRFSGSADALTRVITIDGTPYTIVGVMPRDFDFPDHKAVAWTAWAVPDVVGPRGGKVAVIFRAIARLRPGATPAQAAAEATARARNAPDMGLAARALFGAAAPIDISVVPELQAMTEDVRPALLVLLAAVALLLVTSTANVAGVQLARAVARRREMSIRAAIGAGRSRIAAQLLTENAIIGLSGGVAGLLLAILLERAASALLPAGFPRLTAITIDARIALFTLFVSVVASIVCGALPAWSIRRMEVVEGLVDGGSVHAGGGWQSKTARVRALIMAGQVAIACLLLVSAALLARSFMALANADRGYDPVNVLTASLPLPSEYPPERRTQLADALVERLHAVPGVTHAAYGGALPFVTSGGFTAFTMRSPQSPDLEQTVQAAQRLVSPEYFAAMRLRLVDGRTLTDDDTAARPPVVVVNKTFARQYLGDRPVGFRIQVQGLRGDGFRFLDEQSAIEVVGVVDDMRQDSVEAARQPEIFMSPKQMAPRALSELDPILIVRTAGDPTAFVSTLHSVVHEQDPNLALDSVMTLEDRVMTSLARPRLYMVLVSWFGGFALLITAVGLFGVLSYTVAQRTREIGVRTALGANTREIVALVLRQASRIVAAGLVVGLAAALVSARVLRAFLFGVSPYDALTLVGVSLLVAVVAAVACIVPARRAAGVDPLIALKRG